MSPKYQASPEGDTGLPGVAAFGVTVQKLLGVQGLGLRV